MSGVTGAGGAGAKDLLYVPELASVTKTVSPTDRDRLLRIELPGKRPLGHRPGQFVQVSLMGMGEAPISVCSSPVDEDGFELCIRDMGGLTAGLQRVEAGDLVGIRGPYGNGFPLECMEQMDCLIVAGGIGLAPLRSLIHTILAERARYGRLLLLYGARRQNEILFADEIAAWSEVPRNEILVTVDEPEPGWTGHVGVVTTLFPEIEVDPAKTVVVAMVGPPVMYRFVLAELGALRIPEDQIYFSLERRMKCGVGKCGNCQINHQLVCQDGPVFSATELRSLREGV